MGICGRMQDRGAKQNIQVHETKRTLQRMTRAQDFSINISENEGTNYEVNSSFFLRASGCDVKLRPNSLSVLCTKEISAQ
jgi:hypothetical protein